MDPLDMIRDDLLQKYIPSEREIIGIWATDCLFNPANNGRVFKYKFIIVQTRLGQGCAYSDHDQYDPTYLAGLIGKDSLDCTIEDTALRVACIDSLSEKVSYGYKTDELKICGTSSDKLRGRTEIIIKEAERLIGNLHGKKVVNVGVVGDIIYQFSGLGSQVVGTDFDASIIGKTFMDRVPIISGEYTLDALKNADIAIVTGMTIVTKTLDDIISICRENNVKLIVFAETGSNMGQYYIQKGVDCYLGEVFPFYIFNGLSTIKITRRE